jgi:hypothetical protein
MGRALTAESDFQWDEFVGLSIKDRIRKCHAMAMEAKDLAALADRDMRKTYLDIAHQWSVLADEMQRSHALPA